MYTTSLTVKIMAPMSRRLFVSGCPITDGHIRRMGHPLINRALYAPISLLLSSWTRRY